MNRQLELGVAALYSLDVPALSQSIVTLRGPKRKLGMAVQSAGSPRDAVCEELGSAIPVISSFFVKVRRWSSKTDPYLLRV